MRLYLTDDLMKDLRKRGMKHTVIADAKGWRGGEHIEHREFSADELKLIRELNDDRASTKDTRNLTRQLNAIYKAMNGKKLVNLQALELALQELVKALPHRWMFIKDENTKELDPYLMQSVTYHPAENYRDRYVPARVVVMARGIRRGEHEERKLTILREHLLNGKTAAQVLVDNDWVPETEDLVTEHEQSVTWYEEIRTETGQQFIAAGIAEIVKDDDDDRWSWYRRTKVMELEHNSVAAKLVIDDAEGWGEDQPSTTISHILREDEEEEDEDKINVVPYPQHAYVRAFDLRTHMFVIVHVRNVRRYIFDRRLFDRLVIPEDNKTLVDSLILSRKTDGDGDDIIAGKGRGVIILLSGPPGVGKTLTAEAYCERAKKPLYAVQCSQLGIEPSELEKQLSIVLDRASAWGCGLLIDEADVYIRSRGNDLKQNAVVGVFLRLLEYYNGILFLTTNRETEVDDAIKSRCVAHVRYKQPGHDDMRKIWNIMNDSFKAELPKPMIEKMVKRYKVSGRTIKQLTRLGKTLSQATGRPLDEKMIEWIIQYQDTEIVPNSKEDEDEDDDREETPIRSGRTDRT